MKKGFSLILFLLFTISVNAQSNYIPEISPVDVYGNLEEIGFTTEKDLGSRFGNFWTSTNSSNGIKYTVEVSSDNVNKVESIRATVQNFYRNEQEATQFFKYVGSALFLYNNRDKSNFDRWVTNNFNKDATTSVGSVSIEIDAPSKTIRILKISAN